MDARHSLAPERLRKAAIGYPSTDEYKNRMFGHSWKEILAFGPVQILTIALLW
jgi:hypothetical protein